MGIETPAHLTCLLIRQENKPAFKCIPTAKALKIFLFSVILVKFPEFTGNCINQQISPIGG